MPQQRKMLGLATASQRLLHMGRELQHPKMKGIRCPSTCRPRSDHAAFQERRRTADGHFWLDERRRPDCHKVKSLKREEREKDRERGLPKEVFTDFFMMPWDQASATCN